MTFLDKSSIFIPKKLPSSNPIPQSQIQEKNKKNYKYDYKRTNEETWDNYRHIIKLHLETTGDQHVKYIKQISKNQNEIDEAYGVKKRKPYS
jgi:hypothetical protein